MMQAITYTQYGPPDVLRLAEIERPTPAAGELLVKVHAASINRADRYLMSGKPIIARLMTGGLLRPKSGRIGADIAGEVVAVGPGASAFRPGDAVFADLAGAGFGGFSEYAAVPEKYLAHKPANLTYEEAAAVPMAAVTALQAIRAAGGITPGRRVLVYGASGGVGTFAVQMARAMGAEVTAVVSTRNVATAHALGASRVIDYTREAFTGVYDIILAANGNRSLGDYRQVLVPGGALVVIGGTMSQIFRAMLLGRVVMNEGRKATALTAEPNGEDLAAVGRMIEAGQLRPVIDATYPMSEIVAAMRYLEQERPRGKVVLTVNGVGG